MLNLKAYAWKKRIALQGDTLHYMQELTQKQWLNQHELRQLQAEKLIKLLQHAHDHVPYYRKTLQQSGIVGLGGKVSLERFEHIPFLEREHFQPYFDELKSDDLPQRKWYENWSGGSTGQPIRLLQDQVYFNWNQALKMMFDQWSGRDLVERQIMLWASERDLMVGHETWRTCMGRWMRNERWLNTRNMSAARMEAYIAEINRFQPVQLLAFVESLYELARFAEERRLLVHSPTSIMTTASMLYPHMRDTIERVFQSPVFNRYGSRETGAIACECEVHRGLHVSMLTHYVEVIRADGLPAHPGERGDLVITCLHNYAMPLIRYRIGDIAKWAEQPCSCGRWLPLLGEITGRRNDMFVKTNGELVDGRLFVILLGTQPFIKKFQVVQEESDRLSIAIVLHQEVPDPQSKYWEHLDLIRTKCHYLMGDDCQIAITFVNEIPATASGKYRYTISKVKQDERVRHE